MHTISQKFRVISDNEDLFQALVNLHQSS